MAIITTRTHVEITRIDEKGNLWMVYPKNTLDDVYTDPRSTVNIRGKINFYVACSTDAATADKVVSVPGFSLVHDAQITVVFQNGITCGNATLNVNSTGKKPIKYLGSNLEANMVRENTHVTMVYDGSAYHIIAGVNPAKVSKSTGTKVYFVGTPNDQAGAPGNMYYDTAIYTDTTAGKLYATSFSGNGANLTDLNATKITTGTLAKERLATSGATAGTYGQTSNYTMAFDGTFKIPDITVDVYGRVTSISTKTITIMPNPNTDAKVKSTPANTTKIYLVGTTSATESTGNLKYDTGIYADTTAGRLVASSFLGTTYYFENTNNYINKTSYTGQSATTASISAHIVDNTTSTDTTKALSANQGRLLQSAITNLTTTVETMKGTTGNVGSGTKPVYMSGGAITASSSTVGSSTKPVYMSSGTITASSSNVGNGSKPVYMSSGTITACGNTVGSNTQPVYMSSGTITACGSNIGSVTQPVYMSGGVITQCKVPQFSLSGSTLTITIPS